MPLPNNFLGLSQELLNKGAACIERCYKPLSYHDARLIAEGRQAALEWMNDRTQMVGPASFEDCELWEKTSSREIDDATAFIRLTHFNH